MKTPGRGTLVGILAALLGLGAITMPAHAVTVPNPDPSSFGPDIGGSGFFGHDDTALNLEILDAGATISLGGAEFGFFFQSDPGTLITIFDPADQLPVPQSAVIDFEVAPGIGGVFDIDDGSSVQSTFTPKPDDIGFYLIPSPALQAFFGVPILFSDPTLNAGGEDLVGAFPRLTPPPGFLLGFAGVNPTSGAVTVLGYDLVLGIQSIPEPGTLLLVLAGALTVLGRGHRARRRSPVAGA